MNAFTAKLKAAWDGFKSGQKSLSPATQQWLRGEDDNGSSGEAELSNAYVQSVWVYACVSKIAEQLAGIPLEVSQGKGKGETKLEDGELVQLLANPSPSIDAFGFWELAFTWRQLRGECFLIGLDKSEGIIDFSRAGGRGPKPSELVILRPEGMRHIVNGSRLEGWHYTGSSQDNYPSQSFLPEEVIHIRQANPWDYFRGFSKLQVARLAAQTDFASGQFQKGLMMNNADTGVIVTTDQWLDVEQREMIMAALRDRKRKAGTADRPLFLGGGAKLEKPGISSADMQFLENRKYSRQEICTVFGVPQEILGYTEDANRSVSEAMKASFIENTIMPEGDRMEQGFRRLGKLWGPLINIYFDYDSLPAMKAMQRSRIDAGVKLWSIGVPFNDVNDQLDLGFPEYAWHKIGYLPYSMMPANEDLSAVNTPEVITPDVVSGDETDDTGKAVAKALKAIEAMNQGRKALPAANQKPETRNQKPIHQCAPDPGYAAATQGAMVMVRGKLKRFFWEQRKRVLDRLEAQAKTKAIWDDLFDATNENQLILNLLKVPVQEVFRFGGAQVASEIGAIDFTLPPASALQFFQERQNKITGINETTFNELKDSLSEGLNAGESYDQLADRVKATFKEADQARAESIAVTEVNTAVNGGRHAAMAENEVDLKGWSTSNLANVRPSHLRAEMDYQQGIPVNEAFRVGGFNLMYPGDANGPAEEVINCRCFTFAVLTQKGFSPGKPRVFLGWDEFLKGKPQNTPNTQN
jgi:HK97 family phage portal protein